LGIELNQSPGDPHEQDQRRGAESYDPEGDRPLAEAGKKITHQRQWPGVWIRTVRVGAQDPVADEPDRERYTDQTENECGTEEDQLTKNSRSVSE
jgi:hypothetical protein